MRLSWLALACAFLGTAAPALADDASAGGAATDAEGEAGCDGGGLKCPAFSRYVNDKFAFSVDVPTFLAKKGADADGRGQPFAYAVNGRAIRVRAWAMYNAPVMSVEELFGDWGRRGKVSYKGIAGNTWFVRGTENGQLFYMRSILSDGVITTIEVTYDPAFSDDLEPILARMGASLMTLAGEGVRAKGAKPVH
jgi:hypothetical protein